MRDINDEVLRAIFTKKAKEDRRNLFVRLITSIKFYAKIQRGNDGKITKQFGIRGGSDF